MSRQRSKRRREDTSEEPTEEEESADTSQERRSKKAPSTTKKSRRSSSVDRSDEEMDDEKMDSDDHDCSQPELATKSEAEVGIIEKITLINFMCHTMLEVPFGSNVNFVIGRNGSGKSAIMTGIVVGLGGKANTTNRGSSLKGFIKDKCSYCQIIIKLRNRGKDAYCPEIYGNSIIIERRITSDGSSSYKIKTHDGLPFQVQIKDGEPARKKAKLIDSEKWGKTISSKKEELIHILDQFGIQVDNPVSVLNQDTSRNFLNSSEPKDKYKFFLKATQLDQMSTDYQVILEEQGVIQNTLTRKSQTLPEMKKEVQRLEEKYKDIAQLKTMKEQVGELKKERVWAEVIELEKKLVPKEKEVNNQKEREPRYQQNVVECQNKIAELEQEWQSVQESVNLVTEDARKVQEQKAEIDTCLRQKKNVFREKQSNLKKLKQDMASVKMDEKQLIDKIKEIKQTAMRDLETERNQRQSELQSKREELHASQNQLSTTTHHREQLEKAISRGKERSYGLRNEVSDSSRTVDSIKRNLHNLQSSRGDKLSIFGAWVPELLKRVKQAERRFHRVPVGPIGAHLTLKDQKWALAVESCLKGLAWAFCCHDSHDQQMLRQMMLQVCPKNNVPQIIISRFQDHVYDVSHNRPRCSYSTVLDELVINNPVVANCLIDQAGVETILLIQNPKEARDVMFSTPPPQGARIAYAGNGDQIIGGNSAKSYAAQNSNARYLQQDIEQEIRRLESDLRQQEQHHQQLQREYTELESNINDSKRELQSSRKKAMREQETVNRLMGEISELENYEEEELPDLTTLEDERASYTQQIEELKSQLTQVEEDFEKAQEAVQKQELKKQHHHEKMQEVMEKHDPLKQQQDEITMKIAQQKNNKSHFEKKCKEASDAFQKAEIELRNFQQHVEEITGQATDYCERVETRKTVKSLETEIHQKERRIRTEEQNHGKHEEVTQQYHEAKTKYLETKESMKNLRRYHKRLEEVLKKRTTAYVDYRKFIAIRAKFFFQMMLSQRGYSGRMRFDHSEESLQLEVNVDQGTKKASKDTRSLSGGERSFSTICFIMALWEAMETPFRCLDEFDVFMDMVNRRISMNMMLKVAKEQEERQFILLTPQDMSSIGGGRNVRIFRLRDPERGQTIINFHQEEQDDS